MCEILEVTLRKTDQLLELPFSDNFAFISLTDASLWTPFKAYSRLVICPPILEFNVVCCAVVTWLTMCHLPTVIMHWFDWQVVNVTTLQRDCRSPAEQRSPLPTSPSFDVRLSSFFLCDADLTISRHTSIRIIVAVTFLLISQISHWFLIHLFWNEPLEIIFTCFLQASCLWSLNSLWGCLKKKTINSRNVFLRAVKIHFWVTLIY